MHIPSKVAYSCPENVETTLRLMLTTGPHYGLSYCGCRFHGKFKLQSKGPSDLGLSRREDSLRGPASLHRYCLACANQCANHFYRAMCPSHCEIQNHAYIVQPRQTYSTFCKSERCDGADTQANQSASSLFLSHSLCKTMAQQLISRTHQALRFELFVRAICWKFDKMRRQSLHFVSCFLRTSA